MDGTYDVLFGGEPVGKVFVDRQGLYYRFRCRCGLTGDAMYRLRACWGEQRRDLGILVPMEGDFGLQTRQPVKLFPEEPPRFLVVPRHGPVRENMTAVFPEEPYAYIRRLKEAYLARQREQMGAALPEGQLVENATRRRAYPGDCALR